jgi:hypothetical protein
MKFPLSAFFAGIVFLMSTSFASAEVRQYVKPKIDGYRLDWCYKWGIQCGEAAADRFCKSKGYDQSVNFAMAADIGASTPTKLLGTGQICEDDFCDGFAKITCEREDEEDLDEEVETKFFKKPLTGGIQVNICFAKGVQCGGNAAAKKFCNVNGFAKAISFGQSQPFTPLIPTRYISNGKVCKELFCIGLKNVTCSD